MQGSRQGRVKLSTKLEIKDVALAAAVVGTCVVLSRGFGLEKFEFPLLVGDWPAILFITGSHGGTVVEDRVALVAATALNVGLYTLALLALRVTVQDLWRSGRR